MVRTQQRWLGGLAILGCTMVIFWAVAARAIYLDEDQNITLRARIYSQASIRLEDSPGADKPADQRDVVPSVRAGQLVQHRNFYNPELDAKLTSYTNFLRGTFLDWLAPDDLRFRIAAWGFYDGIYDYGTSQFNETQRIINSNFGNYNAGVCFEGPDQGKVCTSNADCRDSRCAPASAWFIEASKLRVPNAGSSPAEQAAGRCAPPNPPCVVDNIRDLFPDLEVQDPRDIYAMQRRVNELYLSYSKGPFFLRVGKQAISWGEADTIGLLDANNPFDITVAAPGIFLDLEEARIPLWTVRTSYNLFDTLGPFSSGFVEAYWVPGNIDTNTGIAPLLTASPYSPAGRNPQFSSGFPNETYQFVFVDAVPKSNFSNSRYGFRFQTVINREYTVQAWMYTHFPQAPAPLKGPPVTVAPGTQGSRTATGSPLFITSLEHKLTTVYGAATTFFVEPLDSILRFEAEYFENEPGFIPEFNLNVKEEGKGASQGIPGRSQVNNEGTLPVADVLRWEIGLDRFFFFRPLNPTNSFTVSASQVGAFNFDETSKKDFRQGPRKLNHDTLGVNPQPNDFVQRKQVEAFAQVTLLTDYMHGKLHPMMTWVQDVRGTYVLHPQITYRWSDWLLFNLSFVHIGGEYQGPGLFTGKDQATFRVTYQLN